MSGAVVTIELFGVPRLRAGVGRLEVRADRLGLAMAYLAAACPGLAGSVVKGERVDPAYRVSLNGDRFVDDPATPLADGDAVIVMAADAGG